MANLAVSYQYNYGNKSYLQQDQVFIEYIKHIFLNIVILLKKK